MAPPETQHAANAAAAKASDSLSDRVSKRMARVLVESSGHQRRAAPGCGSRVRYRDLSENGMPTEWRDLSILLFGRKQGTRRDRLKNRGWSAYNGRINATSHAELVLQAGARFFAETSIRGVPCGADALVWPKAGRLVREV